MLWVLAVLLAFPAAAAPAKPRLVVERGEGGNRIFAVMEPAAGQDQRGLLRTTSATVVPVAAGGDPAGRAAFVTWNENGRRWFSATQDGGRSWTEATAIETALRFRAGATEPGRPIPPVPQALALPGNARLYVVQFRTLSLPEWRGALEAAGVKVLKYFHSNAHIVRVDPALVPSIAGLDFVERVEPYHPYYRLEPELIDWFAASARGPAELRVQVMAFEWGPEGKARIQAAAEAAGARVAQYYPSGHILELWVNREQLQKLAAHDEVMWIDLWRAPEKDMDLVRVDSGANFLETRLNVCGQGVRGEVMDGGFETTHMDFDGILLHGSNTPDSHGTSAYGIVFGNGSRDGDGNAQGMGQLVCGAQGIAADFEFVIDRFVHTRELKAAPYFASFQSNSWGSGVTTAYNSISHQMDDIIWRLDIAITQSQSNTGDQNSRPQAWAKNVISVGGINHFNTLSTADDQWGGGASVGPAADGRIKPDVSHWFDSIFTTTSGNTYTDFAGTSAATPATAGILGLIVQMWSDNVWGTNPVGTTVFERQPHASTIKALLINSAAQYPFTGTASDLTRTHQGWGRPSARNARDRAANSLVVDHGTPLQFNQSATYTYVVRPGAADLKVTMTYPDPPGTTSTTLHRINDLNLRVTSPDGTVYHGNNGLNAGTTSTPGGSPNTVDTVENVFLSSPTAGVWTIEVRAAAINQDAHLATAAADAVFSLVATQLQPGRASLGSFTVTNQPVASFGDWAASPDATPLMGDFNGDGRTDVALTGVPGWFTLPVAFSNGDGSFKVTNFPIASFGDWAASPDATPLIGGDFNGDGKTDVALTGVPGWFTLPVAFSNGDGSFKVTNFPIAGFGDWAASPDAKPLLGDFNGDGKTDVALTGVPGWFTLPVAFSNGDGSFTVTNFPIASFGDWAASPDAEPLIGDFNGDGKTDVALTGVPGWTTLPVAFSNGNGSFTVKNNPIGSFAVWAASPDAEPLVGDFNGDGNTDVALTGVPGWTTLPVAFSKGNGFFTLTNNPIPGFATWAAAPEAKPLRGDFNGDGTMDVALTGVPGWFTLPVAFSDGDGVFTVTNQPISNFGVWAASPDAEPLVGDFNGDGNADAALTGVPGWFTLPVAFSTPR